MDANGQRFWMLAAGTDWLPAAGAAYDPARRVLTLASTRVLTGYPADRMAARARTVLPTSAVDSFATWARIADDRRSVAAAGVTPEPVTIFPRALEGTALAADELVRDLAMGPDGVLYLVVGSATAARLVLLDRRDRWEPISLPCPVGCVPDRVAAHPDGGAWVLDRTTRILLRLVGQPRPRRGTVDRPLEWGVPLAPRDPPRLVADARWTLAVGDLVDLAVHPSGDALILVWPVTGDAQVQRVNDQQALPAVTLTGAGAPFSLGVVDQELLAVLAVDVSEAVVFPLAGGAPVGDRYPLVAWDGSVFVRGVELPVAYGTGTPAGWKPKPLHRLSKPGLARHGTARGAQVLDGGAIGTVWHRLYAEAALPPGATISVLLAAGDDRASPPADWTRTLIAGPGVDVGTLAAGDPRAAWVSQPSEIPFHPGFLGDAPERDRCGLFTALVQRCGTRVRTLAGRYLWVQVELDGDGSRGPELAALRVYAQRFSYRDRYLPRLYHESLSGPDADAPGDATPADFLDRFLAIAEGMLTPLEDRVAGSWMLTDPRTTPPDALPWLGSWLGLALDPGLPEIRQRAAVRNAMRLFRRRGTLAGLRLALDLVTGGEVTRGGIVVIEDFRLRRTFATLLGVDLADETDPLTQGLQVSGNSIVGDTLFIGDRSEVLTTEMLALFDADRLPSTERAAVLAWYAQLAHRVTILVHRALDEATLGLVRRTVTLETPAHVVSRVLAASDGLLVGLTSLVDVGTWLTDPPPPGVVRAELTAVGTTDFITDLPSLDPRLDA